MADLQAIALALIAGKRDEVIKNVNAALNEGV